MKLELDKRIEQYLISHGVQSSRIQDFLFPKISKMLNPYDLNGMADAVSKIKEAIKNNKKILVFGDYDCDGISAASILVMYFREKGAKIDAFIPNRFDDGYGLSADTINDIATNYKPDLLITVDLGITAIEEVETLKKLGIDVIITDHHEPMNKLPDCVVIDAKVDGQKYEFNGLCGAGVALKLVEALENRKFIEKYLDICAIATIGDIVPLVNENRIIAKFGLEKINKGEALPSIKFLIEKLNLQTISSEDVSFKIVPRLNSSGRMDNGKKVLDFLIETNQEKLEELYEKINSDNEHRLQEINFGNQEILEQIKDIDFSSISSLLVEGNFHQGVLGILASRLCHDYNMPSIVFTKTEEGTLKGSGRSVDDIDIHSILMKMSDLFVRFGGHKLAIGLEIKPENFDKFKERFNQEIKNLARTPKQNNSYDIEIFEEDLTVKFVDQIKLLEPFGCDNEKPVFMLRCSGLTCEKLKGKNFKHFKLHTNSRKQIIAFSSYNNSELLKNKCNKQLFVDLDINIFAGKRNVNCKLNKVVFDDDHFDFNEDICYANSILCRFNSIKNTLKVGCFHLAIDDLYKKAEELSSNKYGTIVVCQNAQTLKCLMANQIIKDNYQISTTPLTDKRNCIVMKSSGISSQFDGYKNYLFFSSNIKNEHLFLDESKNVFDCIITKHDKKIVTSRKIMEVCYKTIKNSIGKIFANDIIEYAETLCYYTKGITISQMIFALLVFYDIGVISISSYTNPEVEIVDGVKSDLSKSKLYNEFN